MEKRKRIFYWVVTGFLAMGMTANGSAQAFHAQGFSDMFVHLGYPAYFLTLLGIWKLLGVVVLLLPKFPVLKEWAYAGFFFVMSGAAFSHIVVGDSILESLPAFFLMTVILLSWYLRPADRKVISAQH